MSWPCSLPPVLWEWIETKDTIRLSVRKTTVCVDSFSLSSNSEAPVDEILTEWSFWFLEPCSSHQGTNHAHPVSRAPGSSPSSNILTVELSETATATASVRLDTEAAATWRLPSPRGTSKWFEAASM